MAKFEIVYHQREAVATLWDAHAWLWHGYELRGLEHLPTEVVNLDHGVNLRDRIVVNLPSPRVEHSLCITMEQYLWTTITWSTESYF